MTRGVAAALTALAAVRPPPPLGAQGGPMLEVAVVRSYRAASGQTLFDAFFRVPFALLAPLSDGPGGRAAYRMTVAVRDSTELELVSQSWSESVPAAAVSVRGGSAGGHLAFAARPGRYTVDVTVIDSASGQVARQRVEVAAFAAPPGASDLLLATGLRAGAPGDTMGGTGEIRKGSVFLTATGRPTLTPNEARLGYYMEIYQERAETLTVTAEVRSDAGARILATVGEKIPVDAGGGATRGTVDLSGLPPGTYRLVVQARSTDSALQRDAGFRMAGFETAAAVAAVAARPADRFERMTEAQLDTVYLPLVYLMTSDERGLYPGLSAEGKRTYLRRFWAKRDPTPGTPRNEAQEDFYSRIADANRRYRERGVAQIPGWRTDRGRVFVKYGPPHEVLQRPQAGSTNPYEVWKYTRGRALKYVFLDLTRFGNYSLIYTNDRRESSRPNWQALLGPEAVLDVERF
jgi:GWxTD domain-containing protein